MFIGLLQSENNCPREATAFAKAMTSAKLLLSVCYMLAAYLVFRCGVYIFCFYFSFVLKQKKQKFKAKRQIQFLFTQVCAVPPDKLYFAPFRQNSRTITNVCSSLSNEVWCLRLGRYVLWVLRLGQPSLVGSTRCLTILFCNCRHETGSDFFQRVVCRFLSAACI